MCDPTESRSEQRRVWGRTVNNLLTALDSERRHLGECNPQYSYYERLVQRAVRDDNYLHTVREHIQKHGGFQGL